MLSQDHNYQTWKLAADLWTSLSTRQGHIQVYISAMNTSNTLAFNQVIWNEPGLKTFPTFRILLHCTTLLWKVVNGQEKETLPLKLLALAYMLKKLKNALRITQRVLRWYLQILDVKNKLCLCLSVNACLSQTLWFSFDLPVSATEFWGWCTKQVMSYIISHFFFYKIMHCFI